ncbi:MAG: DUF72 domain-containing protein [Fibrella sp.]|nr:DUF72 domain-containing protein [Armatimonadota bacterium]
MSEIAAVYIGTMSWVYDDWRGVFYEANLSHAKMLEQLATVFDTVEVDATFYGFPKPTTLRAWKAQTPDGFRFSFKVPRLVTHEQRLLGATVDVAIDFGKLVSREMDEKCGALLLQMPPDFTVTDYAVLTTFADALASSRSGVSDLPWLVELRHASWQDTGIAQYLAERKIAVATTERTDCGGPLRYVRLLGTENSVARFDERQFDRSLEVADWVRRIDDARQSSPEPIYVYVRNFFEGHAPATIADLRTGLGLPNTTPPGKKQLSLF